MKDGDEDGDGQWLFLVLACTVCRKAKSVSMSSQYVMYKDGRVDTYEMCYIYDYLIRKREKEQELPCIKGG